VITLVPLQNIHLRSGKVLQKENPTVVIEEELEEEETPIQTSNDDPPSDRIVTTTQTSPILTSEQPQAPKTPPFPERLALEKPVVQPEFDLET
jgi:hypothetical protein